MSTVTSFDPAADPAWDRYVAAHPQGRSYHLSASLDNVGTAYRCRPLHLALRGEDGSLRGVLPLFEKRGIISGRRAWSLPAVPVGGPLADDREGLAALLAAAQARSSGRGCKLIVESCDDGLANLEPALTRADQFPSLILELPADGLEEWLRSRQRNLRRNIKKAKEGPLVVRDDGGAADLPNFLRIYDESLRGRGLLPRPQGDVDFTSRAGLPPVFRLFVLEHEGRPVGGLLCQTLGASLDLMVIAADAAVQQHRSHHALYMRAIEWAVENGLARVDFGRPAADSHGEFKETWGAAPVPCFVYSSPAAKPPVTEMEQSTSERAWLREAIERTPPALLTRAASFAYRRL